jgi:hypothetical protein
VLLAALAPVSYGRSGDPKRSAPLECKADDARMLLIGASATEVVPDDRLTRPSRQDVR